MGTGQTISVWNDPRIPAPHPRSAKPKTLPQFLNTSLKVDHLIDAVTKFWNEELLNAYIHSNDVKVIKGLAISRNDRQDTFGWSFTETGKYTVKLGYRMESLFPNKAQEIVLYGPDIKPLLAFSWTLKCSPKLRHFVWQVISGTIPVLKNLRARGINCDTRCSICGAEEESANYALFECPPSLQTWDLSKIPSAPGFFPTSSVFTNMDYLFWRLPEEYDF